MHTHLNAHGVKDSAGMWRTVNGVKWPHLTVEQYAGQAAYLRQYVRVKRVGCEIFVHPADVQIALKFTS